MFALRDPGYLRRVHPLLGKAPLDQGRSGIIQQAEQKVPNRNGSRRYSPTRRDQCQVQRFDPPAWVKKRFIFSFSAIDKKVMR